MQRSFSRIVLAAVTIAGFASLSRAQTPTQAAGKAAPTVPAPSPAQSAAALELFKAIKLESSLPNTSAAMIDSEINRNPAMAPYRDTMLNWLKKYMTWNSMLPELTRLYVDTYSEAELKELAAFYRTPTGQKSLTKMPELMQKTAMIGAKLGQEHSEELKTAMNARREELMKQQEKAQATAGAAKTPGSKAPAPAKPATPAPKKP